VIASGCRGFIGEAGQPAGGDNTNNPGTGSGGSTGGTPGCDGDLVPDAKRVVRLSFNQMSVSIHTLFGDTLGNQVDTTNQIGPDAPTARTFPPLANAQEGGTIIQHHWQLDDAIAQQIGQWVHDNLAAVAGGTAPTTDAAAQTFLTGLAQKVYRRPMTSDESASLLQVYTEVKALYNTVPDAIQYTVYAMMQAPQFLYRSELGTDQKVAGVLTPYELASALSYFLTDGPPDAMLLASAASGALSTPAEVGKQATRILMTQTARTNLGAAMFSYFALDSLTTVQISDPGWTFGTMTNPYSGVRESSYHEAQLFLDNNLWSGPLATLITGKQSQINATLAPLYGITTFPPAGAKVDADGFAQVDLPDNRAGILTSVAFLAARSRPDVPSVVGRGLAVNAALLCAVNPPFPSDAATQSQIAAANTMLATATEREKANFRATTSPCFTCHPTFDPYGLALERYDIIGRFQTMDSMGRPIDPSVTLPANAGGQMAADAVDMANKISAAPGFASCVTKNMINWALAEGSQLTPNSCSTQAVAKAFQSTDKSFSSLLTQIAQSQAFMNRSAGVN
jgi:hypothetical protein